MATPQASDMEPNLTECAVCHDVFTVPKLLPCSHILCRGCLVTWIQSQPQAGCPLCRCVIVDPIKHEGMNVEGVADGFPTDLAMTALVEAETLLSKQHVCCVCANVAAVALCLQCGDFFCQNCSNVHKKQSLSKHHEVEQLSSLTTEKLAAHHPNTCPNHMDKVSEVYCTSHDTSLCVLCATTTHRKCPELMNLSTKIGELSDELFQLDDKLEQAVNTSTSLIRMLDNHVQELEKDSQSALQELNKVCERLKAAVDARFLKVKKETLDFVRKVTEKITDFRKGVMQTRSKSVTQKKMTGLYRKFTEHKHFKDMVTLVKGRNEELIKVVVLPDDLQLNHKLSIDLQTLDDIEKNLSKLGDRKFTPHTLNTNSKIQAPATNTAIFDKGPVGGKQQLLSGQKSRFDPTTASPSKGIIIETRSQEDQEEPDILCVVTSLSAEELYLADYGNKSIKVCSVKSGRLISTLPLNVGPRQMTLVSENLLAVTTTKCLILLISIADISRPRLQNKILTTSRYKGITVDRSRKDQPILVVSSAIDRVGQASVDMMTLTGKHVRTLANSQNLPGLLYPWHLGADTQRDVLFISDHDSHCLFSVQLSTAKLIGQLKHSELSYPRQVCIDSAGNVYVASEGGQCVLVMSTGKWRVLLTAEEHGQGKDDRPYAISIAGNAIIVSWGSGLVRRYDLMPS